VGESQIYVLCGNSTFEEAYLVNETAQATLAWIPRLVMDEREWIEKNVEGGVDLDQYRRFRAFSSLYEARVLAALTQFELGVYRGTIADPEDEFRSLMRAVTGARVSSGDSRRAMEFLSQLRSASRFQGLLLAAGIRKHLADSFGETWYEDGKSGALLRTLWQRGGALNVQEIIAAAELTGVQANLYLDGISSMLP
jgi:hypothetical protein